MIVINIITGIVLLILVTIILYVVGLITDKIMGEDSDINIGGSILLGLFSLVFIISLLIVANIIGNQIISLIK